MRQLLLILIGGAAVYGAILWLGGAALRSIATIAAILWGAALCLMVLPQHIFAGTGMPRRYIDAPETIVTWYSVANIASLLAVLCAAFLLVLLAIAVVQKLREGGRAIT
ncbi:hypothetical protein [Gymnodinialimonas hymeniacidonis]|uniref:hypothetical protein n=1 Tax=Gymnodinialimonas hymeniacidonis TaxID=3126508 RepID=UPI0034C5D972